MVISAKDVAARGWPSLRSAAVRQAALTQSQTSRQGTDLQIQVEAAQRAFDLAERSYQLGSTSNLDRLTLQDALLNAQLDLVAEQFNDKAYYLSLLRSSGRISSVLKDAH